MILIFDYDGTCHDTIGIYGRAVRKAAVWLKEQGYVSACPTDDRSLTRYLGMNTEDMWHDFLPEAPADVKRQAAELIGRTMAEYIENGEARLYEGMEELLAGLKERGHTLLVLSNCTNLYRDTHWRVFDLGRFFSKFYTSEMYAGLAKEQIFETIRREYPGEYCVIGDRCSDLKVGKTHGFPSVACHYGYGTEEELAGADHHACSVKELKVILAQLTE